MEAVCLRNNGCEFSLEVGGVYQVVDPEANDPPDCIRVIDESGEDYLYPSDWFERRQATPLE